jgi:hypothetical protein
MKNIKPIFIPYDDGNLEISMSGPDYGQVGPKFMAWTEIESSEYEDFVDYLAERIISRKIRLFSC